MFLQGLVQVGVVQLGVVHVGVVQLGVVHVGLVHVGVVHVGVVRVIWRNGSFHPCFSVHLAAQVDHDGELHHLQQQGEKNGRWSSPRCSRITPQAPPGGRRARRRLKCKTVERLLPGYLQEHETEIHDGDGQNVVLQHVADLQLAALQHTPSRSV